jgi:5-methylcytosine-specific restriction endonuclease McrA
LHAGGTNEQWNLLALCRSCHHSAEQYLSGLFESYFVE